MTFSLSHGSTLLHSHLGCPDFSTSEFRCPSISNRTDKRLNTSMPYLLQDSTLLQMLERIGTTSYSIRKREGLQ